MDSLCVNASVVLVVELSSSEEGVVAAASELMVEVSGMVVPKPSVDRTVLSMESVEINGDVVLG